MAHTIPCTLMRAGTSRGPFFLLDSLPAPVWARDRNGRLIFVNAAYARAVDAEDSIDAVARELELLDRAARDILASAHATAKSYSGRLPAIAGEVYSPPGQSVAAKYW